MTRDEKRSQAEALHQALEKAQCVFLSGFEGLTVSQDTDLRRRVAQAGARYRVVKNSLVERAARGTAAEAATRSLHGTTSLAYTEADPVALARVLTAYAKENPTLVFKVGVVEGRVFSLAELASLAALPGRPELLSRALFLLNAPARGVAMTLAGVARNLVSVIQQAVKEKKFSEAAGG